MAAIYLLACALSLGQSADRAEWLLTPQYVQGMELVYKGTCTEESLVPGVQHNRQYTLETMLLVQEAKPRHWEAVLQTSLSVRHPQKAGDPKESLPPGSVRLEMVQIDIRGRLRAVQDVSLAIPLGGPPLLETGAFCELPTVRVNPQSYWEATEEGRPLRSWQIAGVEQRGGTACVKLLGSQQSSDWLEPRADSTAWQRKDLLWFAPQMGLVYRVERTIDRREPARQDPTHRTTVAYELDSPLKYRGKMLEDRLEEIAKARKFLDEAAPLLRQPAQHRGQIDALGRRVKFYLDNHSPTPYRKAIVHLQTRLENARQGELPPEPGAEERAAFKGPAKIGQKVPDFIITDVISQKTRRFYQFLGQPILVVYYNPASATGKQALLFAQSLYDRYSTEILILAMAVSDDADMIRKQHEDMGLSFPILDGRAMHQTFGVDGTPRVILLDGDGLVRCSVTGWGLHTPAEITEEVKNCLPK